MLAALVPSPARATTLVCQTLLKSTPGARLDLDGDGHPEAQVPALYDVTLCSEAGASYVTYPPTTERCFVGWHPTCMAVYVTVVPADADAGARGELCYTVEGGGRSCGELETAPVRGPDHQTACIGYDVNGGHPCSGSTLALTFQ